MTRTTTCKERLESALALCFTWLEALLGDAAYLQRGREWICRMVAREMGDQDLRVRFQKILRPVVDGAAEGPAEGWQKVLGA